MYGVIVDRWVPVGDLGLSLVLLLVVTFLRYLWKPKFLESCKIVKLIFFWVGSFAACHEISKSFCGRIPFCTVRCGKGCKDFRCILVSWFIFHYFECDYIHMLKLACGGEWWMLFWWVCEWQVSLPLAIIVQHCTCHCTSLHRFSTPCMCSSKLPWIFAYIML